MSETPNSEPDLSVREVGKKFSLRGEQLRKAAPFLKLDQVRAGDVLISCSENPRGKATAIGSDGLYSHAALFLPGRPIPDFPPHLELVEADEHGVGATWQDILSLSQGKVAPIPVVSFPGLRRLLLLRHPQLAAMSPDLILSAAERLRAQEFYRAYSLYERLARVSFLGPLWHPILRRALRLIDRRRAYDPGAFCSELVAKFFQELDVPLFHHHLEPASVSPSRLIALDCRLVLASAQPVIWEESLDVHDVATGVIPSNAGGIARATLLPRQVRQHEAMQKVTSAVEVFNKGFEAVGAERREDARAASAVRAQLIQSQAFEGGTWHPAVIHASAARLLRRVDALQQLEHALADLESGPDWLSTLPAQFALREFAAMLGRELSFQASRRQALAALWSSRGRCGGPKARRRIARISILHRRDHYRDLNFSIRLGRPRTIDALMASVEADQRQILVDIFDGLDTQAGGGWSRPWSRE
ncbi:hypothetical protein [Phenylobacterium sp.]|uniref:hypothetical protein n=1 Tax=Phenylobacterium sp. TaxID=1871053 RepID=UPI002731B782|nr:hypothetical protein [Phenylobacterium sp.]MDP1874828.1 hypothetical protein [Phenylobacterium sp.]